jgi:MoaA/NifB/PqqE/SkfB family radical SAM enzyme
MNFWSRAIRHTRITLKNYGGAPSPPFLIFFINSICNQKCEHCFYWRSLNSKDDLTFEEIKALSRSLGRIENLNLSGGEPFLRPEFSDICKQFIRENGVRQIYVPTNGTFLERTIRHITAILEEKDLDLFVVEHSLDGMPEFHDRFRGQKGGFAKSIETYDALAELQKRDPRLRMHAISTATDVNMDEIRRLTTFLYKRCPQMDHHNLALIRGDRKNPDLKSPDLVEYKKLYDYIKRLWAPREENRYGSIVEPMLQWAKAKTAAAGTQVVPCRAGVLSAVVYANGDVSFCENHEPVGNLRKQSFTEIWKSARSETLRRSIRAKECTCTNEVFLWPSIVYQPTQLLRAIIGAKPWQSATPLPPEEHVFVPLDALVPAPAKACANGIETANPVELALPVLSKSHD